MAPFLKAPCLLPAPEFKQKEECTIRGRNLIQISIQEDPWNLPNSIKTLVDNIQRYVEGQSGREGCYVAGLWHPVLNVEHRRVSSGPTSVPPSLQAPGEDRKRQCCFLRALGQHTRGQGTAHLGCLGFLAESGGRGGRACSFPPSTAVDLVRFLLFRIKVTGVC